jgi:hypothetical protein
MSKDKSRFQLTTLIISLNSFRVDNKGLHCQNNFNVLFVTELGRSKKDNDHMKSEDRQKRAQ